MSGKTTTILLVDDEQRDLEVIRAVLERAGYHVLTAENSSLALECCRTAADPIDLLVTDVALPGKNGVDLYGDLRTLCQHDLKVLFISAWSGSELLRSHGVSMTDQHFLAKPFSAKELLSRVRDVLNSTEPFPMDVFAGRASSRE